ncbi:Steroidogenic acute regulatory related lipid transfer domain-containing protein [Cryptosporidium canis]|uniref:Steroidogenic acute regulatory related lipid transfer domain-containing protein n=1 Tax=Cryptosporidium canis TaxID=195482 RepID=A0A9D5HVJ0_9CRYT|nr:Steroidogenic acute regulatory related lipid transfer domain-containing protein [Cryptosporidium canis]
MSSSNSMVTENRHKELELKSELEFSVHSTISPSEPEYEHNFKDPSMEASKGSQAELNSPTDEYSKKSSNLKAFSDGLSKEKKFKHKMISKIKTLLSPSRKTRKMFSLVHKKRIRSSRSLEYNFISPSNTSPPRSSRYFSFLRKLSRNSNFNKANLNKPAMESSIEKFEKLNSKSSVRLNFGSLLLNNICIAEDADIQMMGSLETTYNFNEEISSEENFKSIFEILPIKPKRIEAQCIQNEEEGLDMLSTKRQESISSNISFMDNNNSNHRVSKFNIDNINTLLENKVSMLAEPGKFEEYLKSKFEELEESRSTLSNFLRASEESHELLGDNENDRVHMYFQLANKLSELSFECLLSSSSELTCQLVYNKDGVRVWKKEHKSGRVLLRTEFIVPVAPLDYVEYSTDSRNRRVYDNNTVDLRVVETVSPGLDVMYVATKRIATVYPRDIVNIRFLHGFNLKNRFKFMSWDELSTSSIKNSQEDVICCSFSCSIEHPDAPERQGYVRMDLSIGSYMAIPIKTPFGIWSSISMFNEASPKGWIPSSVTKMIAVKMVPGSVESIVSSMLAYHKFPFRNKVNRPLSGFCYRALTAIFSDQKKLECLDNSRRNSNLSTKGVNNGTVSRINDSKSSKSNSKISCLLNRPLLISIQDFIATYKSNTLQEFIEHFNSVRIINRYVLSASTVNLPPNNSDINRSNDDISRIHSIEAGISKNTDNDFRDASQSVTDNDPKVYICNLPIEKIQNSANQSGSVTYLNNSLNVGEFKRLNCSLPLERPSSFEFCEATYIVNNEVTQGNESRSLECDSGLTYDQEKIDRKRLCNLFISSCKLYQSLGASYLAEISDIITLVRLSSLE